MPADPHATYLELLAAIREYKRASRRRAYAMTYDDRKRGDDAVDAASDRLNAAEAAHETALGIRRVKDAS